MLITIFCRQELTERSSAPVSPEAVERSDSCILPSSETSKTLFQKPKSDYFARQTTIFMNFRSRSSRATAPKIRVPFGFPSLSTITIALRSNRTYEPSERRPLLGPNHNTLHNAPQHGLHFCQSLLNRNNHDVPKTSVSPTRTTQHLNASSGLPRRSCQPRPSIVCI